MNVSLESDDPNPSEYQLVMDGDESEMDIPNLIYPFTIIMSTCIISAAAYISLSKKTDLQSTGTSPGTLEFGLWFRLQTSSMDRG